MLLYILTFCSDYGSCQRKDHGVLQNLESGESFMEEEKTVRVTAKPNIENLIKQFTYVKADICEMNSKFIVATEEIAPKRKKMIVNNTSSSSREKICMERLSVPCTFRSLLL